MNFQYCAGALMFSAERLERFLGQLPPDTPAGSAARRQRVAEALRSSHWRAVLEGIDASHAIALCQKPGTNDEIITFSSVAPRQVDYEIVIRLAVYAMHAAREPTIRRATHLSARS